MKQIVSFLMLMLTLSVGSVSAQNYALIDMEYMLGQIPAYKQATEQIEQAGRQWQNEVQEVTDQAKALYQEYQKKVSSLSDAQRAKEEEAVIAKEKEAADLRKKYFGPEGELAKKQQALIRPIEDRIYEAVKQVAQRDGYDIVLDRASAQSVIFASPDIDISNDVLDVMGYSN